MAVDTVQDDVVVSITYVLTVDDQEIDRAEKVDPLDYLHGAENIVPGLEAALTGKKIGDKISVTLSPDDAYGMYDDDDVEEVPLEDLDIPVEELEIGMPMEVEDEDGFFYQAFLREINDDAVILDFNHPLAGKTLSYDAEVVGLREATEQELDHGHVHYDDFDDDEDDED